MEFLEHRLVVDLVAVRDGDEPAAAVEAHDVGLVVVGPVADIFAAFRRQQIGRVPGLLQPGAEPAGRPRAGRLCDRRERAVDDAFLLAGRRFVEPPRVALAMPHPFPAELLALCDDLGMLRAKVAVERDGAADAVPRQHTHQPEHADAVAVVARRPGRNVRHRRARAAGARRDFFHQREELDIWDYPERDVSAVRPAQRRPVDDRRIRKRAVRRASCHILNSAYAPSS